MDAFELAAGPIPAASFFCYLLYLPQVIGTETELVLKYTSTFLDCRLPFAVKRII
jgi:hypothetical protein